MLYSILAFGLFMGKGGGGFDGYLFNKNIAEIYDFSVIRIRINKNLPKHRIMF